MPGSLQKQIAVRRDQTKSRTHSPAAEISERLFFVFSLPRTTWFVALAAFTIPLGFAFFSEHAWEDYFITLRSSRNLVEGHGLVFNPGERVHTFTSPLGVLLPALCTWLAGPGNDAAGLWLFRIVSALFLAAAALLVWRRADTLRVGKVGRLLIVGMLLLDAKLTDFATNGMETAMLVYFVLLLWSELESPHRPHLWRVAIAIAGLMWTRPDAFILGAAVILPHFIIRGGEPARVRAIWPSLWKGMLLGGLIYAPWFAWAWLHYGSPVPHTIIAKAAYTVRPDFLTLLQLPLQTLLGKSMLIDLFLPSYWTFGGWPPVLTHIAHALTVIAALAWIIPALPAAARRVSLGVFMGMFYLCSIILFPWYVPPWTALAILAIGLTFDALHQSCQTKHRPLAAGSIRIAGLIAVVAQLGIFAATAWQMRVHQTLIENSVRREIGLWLKSNARPGDTLFLEPLGYIGYYSQLKTFDFPGLSSPEVAAVVRSGGKRYSDIIGRLRPNWVVLRAHEVAGPELRVLDQYERVRSWDVLAKLDAIQFLPGRTWVENDARYSVFRRRE